jgi:hypothetical protein
VLACSLHLSFLSPQDLLRTPIEASALDLAEIRRRGGGYRAARVMYCSWLQNSK